MERDLLRSISSPIHFTISTHTLTWSVTNITKIALTKLTISTHTLTWSVTNNSQLDYIPTTISTHTLTWSVTSDDIIIGKMNEDFNSHAHVERDKTASGNAVSQTDFNSHAHVERDHI